MGLVTAKTILENPRYPDLEPIGVDALADTGSVHPCIPQYIAGQLGLKAYDKKDVIIADGSRQLVPDMGPIQIRSANRAVLGGALVIGDEVLFGAIPREDLDLIVNPKDCGLRINPLNPNFACSTIK